MIWRSIILSASRLPTIPNDELIYDLTKVELADALTNWFGPPAAAQHTGF